ncbi:right-handed parallel beta-helix repeat-containing protein [Alteromonas sediminis]|nr:right-handed parallel beta-helix repeat-containing protein [Alteromonas sediminis]
MTLTKIVICITFWVGYLTNSEADVHRVSSESELYKALVTANHNQVRDSIEVTAGVYELDKRLQFTEANTKLVSASGIANDVILRGKGMRPSATTEVLLDIAAKNISVSGITLEAASHHLIQVRAEADADNFTLTNCVLRDAYQQLFKVSATKESDSPHADFGHISHCLFEYSAGIGPQYYIGGIDAHRIRNWTIANNTFKAIASPAERVAQHAIHIWNNSSNNLVISNTIIDSDRGIGFGMGNSSNQNTGGKIINNLIVHTAKHHRFADVGIILESSPHTEITNNTILMNGRYPNAIEYRFTSTHDVVISGNQVNRRITSRDGGSARLVNNKKLK